MPKAIYRWLRMAMGAAKNPNPVILTKHKATITSFQVTKHLLCPACEARFETGGEGWVLKNCYRGLSSFPLQAALRAMPVLGKLNLATMIDAGISSVVDLQKLVYFAVSVFWRAGVCDWWGLDHSIRINLGPYEEPLRLYLLGQAPFPERAALVINVANDSKPELGMIYPYSGRVHGTWQHKFSVPGIMFWLHLGHLSPALKTMSSPDTGIVFLANNLNERFAFDTERMIETAKVSESVMQTRFKNLKP